MVRFLRTASPRTLLISAAALVAMLAGGTVVATGATSDSQRPLAKPLAQALADSEAAAHRSDFAGASARISYSNRLLDNVDTGQGASPLLGSGSGRLWVSADGKLRVELQSDSGGGDVQLLADGKQAWLSIGDGSTVYRVAPERNAAKAEPPRDGTPPTVATIESAIKSISGEVKISEPAPDNVAGRPAYTVTVEPVDRSSLIGGARVSWDSVNGTPLAIAILAKDQSGPALDLRATDVAYGPVAASVLDIKPPAGAKITDIDLSGISAKARAGAAKTKAAGRRKAVVGLAAVQASVPFKLTAPDSLAGLDRQQVVLLGKGEKAAAAIRYGTGLGAITVIERRADAADKTSSPADQGMQLPTKRIGRIQLAELGTVLGAAAEFSRDGVTYAIVGSAPLSTVEAVAAGL